jgi:hypothetical protein
VENNRIRSLRSENKDLRDEFRACTSTDENSNRVGEFAIGANTACTHVIGHILQDEKIPVFIAFGHPYESTLAQTGSPKHTLTVSTILMSGSTANKSCNVESSCRELWSLSLAVQRRLHAGEIRSAHSVNQTEKWLADFRISETPIFLTNESPRSCLPHGLDLATARIRAAARR